MATPLQIISINSLERAIVYQNYTRESIVVVQQERKMRHRKASPSNDLDPESREFDEWVTKNHMMLPNYLLDQIGILIQSREQVYESCCVTESYPALKRTYIQDPTCLDRSPRKKLFNYDCQSIPFYENQEGSIRDLAERENYWNIESIESPESTEKKDEDQQTPKTIIKPDIFPITQQQQQQTSSASSSTSSVNLSNWDTAYQCLLTPKKRKLQFRDLWKLKKLCFHRECTILGVYYLVWWVFFNYWGWIFVYVLFLIFLN